MKIRLTFLGAAQNVTGSRYLLELDGFKLMVDCGLYQERQLRHRNWDEFPISPKNLDTILLTHAHLDHCGWLPKLGKEGFGGKIHATAATAEIARFILLDSAHIQEEDAEYKLKRHKREKRKGPHPEAPLYTTEDAEKCLPLFAPVKYRESVEIGPGITARYYNAGHILGSASILLTINRDGQTRTILFSGDIGRWDIPILRDPRLFEEADYILVESTYGNRVHEDTADIKSTLAEIINATHEAGGNIVIPSFAVERSQELLYYLNELLIEDKIPPLMTFLDSPMAINVTQVFKKHPELFDEEAAQRIESDDSPFEFPGLAMTRRTSQSKAINHITGTILIIAGSGMCTGGRVKHHLVNNITRPESTILFVGYQAYGTLGRYILDGPDEVRILGQTYPVRARIDRLYGFSGHADKNELDKWIGAIKKPPKELFVVHGEKDSSQHLANFVREKYQWKVTVPSYQQEVVLD